MLFFKKNNTSHFYLVSFLLCFCLSNQLLSQVTIQPIKGDYGVKAFTIYGSNNLAKKDKIPYSRIKGSPFLKDNWQLATLYSGTLKLPAMPIRLNLASNEIHFMKDEKEAVLESTQNISTILFHPDNDSSKVGEIFIVDTDVFINNKKVEGFLKIMNSGDYKLLKYVERKVNSTDSLFNTQKKYFFSDEAFYFMWSNEKIEWIKKFNKDYILTLLPSSSNYTKWIDQKDIDFKKEEDVIRFLNHYNTVKKDKNK